MPTLLYFMIHNCIKFYKFCVVYALHRLVYTIFVLLLCLCEFKTTKAKQGSEPESPLFLFSKKKSVQAGFVPATCFQGSCSTN